MLVTLNASVLIRPSSFACPLLGIHLTLTCVAGAPLWLSGGAPNQSDSLQEGMEPASGDGGRSDGSSIILREPRQSGSSPVSVIGPQS